MDVNKIYSGIIENWRKARGVGTITILKPLNPNALILGLIQRIYSEDSKSKITDKPVLIVTNTFEDRQQLVSYITHSGDDENDKEIRELIDNKKICIYTKDYVNGWFSLKYYFLAISVGINENCNSINNVSRYGHFKLIILTDEPSSEDKTEIYKLVAPIQSPTINDLIAINLNSPVEEERIAINISDSSFKLYEEYQKYITESINIFGSFDVMNQARVGNAALNISAASVRQQIAEENGWSEHLDMNIPFNTKIDEIYNPNSLYDRVELTYDIIRKKSQLLSDNEAKLDVIGNICKENVGKKILIISKRSEFAETITQYLNAILPATNPYYGCCGSYHNAMEPIDAIDDNGYPILIKSGANKGKQRKMGVQAQKSLFERLFSNGNINILSANNAADKTLECNIDLLIITSPTCDDIKEIKYRLSNVVFNSIPNKVIMLYCNKTNEEKILTNRSGNENYTIIDKEKNIILDENFDSIVVD